MESGHFTDDDREALRRFLEEQEKDSSGGFGKDGEDLPLTPEQNGRLKVAQEYIQRYFSSFTITDGGDLVPHAQRMKVTLPLWKKTIRVRIQRPNELEESSQSLEEVYPNFGLKDIVFSANYLRRGYENQVKDQLPGTPEHRASDGQAKAWRILGDIASMAIQMDSGEKPKS